MNLRERLKWWIAPKEMAELERWRWATVQADRWLASFPVAVIALDHVRGTAEGWEGYNSIETVRDTIRELTEFSDSSPVGAERKEL